MKVLLGNPRVHFLRKIDVYCNRRFLKALRCSGNWRGNGMKIIGAIMIYTFGKASFGVEYLSARDQPVRVCYIGILQETHSR